MSPATRSSGAGEPRARRRAGPADSWSRPCRERSQRGGAASRLAETFELVLKDGRYLINAARGSAAHSAPPVVRSDTLGGVRLQDVAAQVGLDFRQSAFRFAESRTSRTR